MSHHELDANMIARCADNGITQYTAVQIFMAYDEWCVAKAEYETALDGLIVIDDKARGNSTDSLWFVYYARNNKDYAALHKTITAITEAARDFCPLISKTSVHSHEVYPVDTTLRYARQLRTSAKKISKAIEAYNKAVAK